MATINIFPILIALITALTGESAYELYSIGNQLELTGNVPAAIEYYKKALEIDPEAIDIYLSIANAYYKIRKLDEGIAWASKGSIVAPENEQVYLTIGTGYIGKADFKKAIEYYKIASGYKPEDLDIRIAVSTLYDAVGDSKMAKQALLEIPEELKNAEIYIKLAAITGRANDHTSAIDYYRRAYALDSSNMTAIIGIGTGFDLLGIKDSSIFYYGKTVDYDTFLTVSKRLIDLYSDTDQYDKLVNLAQKILAAEYYETAVRRSLGYALYKTGATRDALNEFLLTSRIDPADTYSKFYVARIYLEQGKYDAARDEIMQAIRVNPDFIELWVYLGFIAMDTKDYQTAASAFSEAAHRSGDLGQIYYLHGIVAEMENNDVDAYYYYKKSLSVDTNSLAALEALANLCDRTDKKKEAFKCFKKIIALDTTNAVALNYVGYTYAEEAESLDYALQLIEKAMAYEANNAYYMDSRGWVYYQKQRYDDALIDLQRASEIVQDAVILEHVGDAYMKLNDSQKAGEAYKRAIELEPGNKTIKNKLKALKVLKGFK